MQRTVPRVASSCILFLLAIISAGYAFAVLDADMISHTIPPAVHPGDIFQVSITVQNTGTEGEHWVRPVGFASTHRLYSQTDPTTIWGPALDVLEPGDEIKPGMYKTFTMLLTAPATPGTYPCKWQMAQNVTPKPIPFGELLDLEVEVTNDIPKTLDAAVVSHTIPSAMCAGEIRAISITMRNTGSTTVWYRSDYRIQAQNSPQPDDQWSLTRINLNAGEHLPGSITTFTGTITAPVTPGSYNCNWQMELRSLPAGTEFFGEKLETVVSVVGDDGACDDGNECTGDGTCSGTVCTGASPVTDGTACDTANSCTTYTCTGGVCGGTINTGSPCDDGNNCTSGDTCAAGGVCTGTVLDCSGLNDTCTLGVCNPYTAGCIPDSTYKNAASCTDDLYCNGTDTCWGGTCEHTGNPCTPESCDEEHDICGPGAEICTDGTDNDGDTLIDCADDDCDGQTCNDGIPCTENDTCMAGICSGTPNDALCDDTNACTDDACNAGAGCAYTNNTDPCDDGLFCNGDDTCSEGSCIHSGNPCEPPLICNETLDACAETVPEICTDGIDNDGDTFIDCADADCSGLSCDDGLFCNGGDTCNDGICEHSGNPCEPPLICNENLDECGASVLDAIIVDHTIPTALYPGEPRHITVTVRNTGTGEWSGNRYALGTRNDPRELWTPVLYFPLGDTETVPANGGERTFNFIITAPAAENFYDCNWQMVNLGSENIYFGEMAAESVTVGSSVTPQLGALELANTISTDMYPGETRSATITLQNTGTVTWDETNVRLHAPDATWGNSTSYSLGAGETVATGQQKQFTIFITAPPGEGSYNCVWQMQGVWNWGEGNQLYYFGDRVSEPVNVNFSVTPFLGAAVVSHTIPSQMNPGETRLVTVTLQNTGTAPWDGNETVYRFRLRTQNSPVDLWGILNVNLDLSDIIESGQQKTFTFNITAPATPAAYSCRWQMQKQWPGNNALYGELLDVPVYVGTTAPVCGNGVLESGEDCDDGNTHDGDCCSATCAFEAAGSPCEDGAFCTGNDTCNGAGTCQPGAAIDCSDGIGCTDDSCDEMNDTCINIPNDANCPDDSVFCNGNEYCDAMNDCLSSGNPCPGTECTTCQESTDSCFDPAGTACADDANPCTDDVCDGSGLCTHTNNSAPCDDAMFCNGEDTCSAGSCSLHNGDPCISPLICSESADACVECLIDSDCNDEVMCTVDSCQPDGTCLNTPSDLMCNDGIFCNGTEICDVSNGCQAGVYPCPDQLCDDENDQCAGPIPFVPTFLLFTPSSANTLIAAPVHFTLLLGDGDGYEDLTSVRFVIKEGAGTGTTSDAIIMEYRSAAPTRIYLYDQATSRWIYAVMGSAIMLENGLCVIDASQTSVTGNGTMLTLNLNITPKAAFIADPLSADKRIWLRARDLANHTLGDLEIGAWSVVESFECDDNADCDDGIDCTVDTCTLDGICLFTPDNVFCDDGLFCNGTETCDALTGCLAGTDPCPGQLCDEVGDICVDCLTDADCDDGFFCNGAELCAGGSCLAGADPCPGQFCDEAGNTCVDCLSDTDCDDGLFCNGLETCVEGTCTSGTNPCIPPLECDEAIDTCIGCLTDEDCDDGIDCTADTCEPDSTCLNTHDNALCDDGIFCNGTETCNLVSGCLAGTDPCPGQFCDEVGDICVDCLTDADCDDGLFCNGTEICAGGSCQPGTNPCPGQSCDEANDQCIETLPPEPTLISFAPESGTSIVGISRTFTMEIGDGDGYADLSSVRFVIKEGAGTGTTSDAIILEYRSSAPTRIYMYNQATLGWIYAVMGSATTLENALCSINASQTSVTGNGNVLTLNLNITPKAAFIAAPISEQKRIWLRARDLANHTLGDLEIGAWSVVTTFECDEDADCDDEIVCTVDTCTIDGTCLFTPDNALCDDGLFCNGTETCDALTGCLAGTDPCPGQFCDEVGDICVDCLTDADCDDGFFCNGAELCAGGSCQPGTNPCPGQLCDEAGNICVDCLSDTDCDDGLFCTGLETCAEGTCTSGTNPCIPPLECDEGIDTCFGCLTDEDCDDGIDCTIDSCESGSICLFTPDSALCDDGFFCNGAETCDALIGCITGTDPCPGQLCDEAGNICVDCLTDADCDDGLFCNGTEICAGGSCLAGTDPCPGQSCDEANDQCIETLPPEPTFISFAPESGTSIVGMPRSFTLELGDGDGYADLKSVRFVIKEGAGTGTTSDAIILEYRSSAPTRIYLYDPATSRWIYAVMGSATILENGLCVIDASQISVTGNGTMLTLNLNITPKAAFIADPLSENKRIWLRVKDVANHTLGDLEIGSWEIIA